MLLQSKLHQSGAAQRSTGAKQRKAAQARRAKLPFPSAAAKRSWQIRVCQIFRLAMLTRQLTAPSSARAAPCLASCGRRRAFSALGISSRNAANQIADDRHAARASTHASAPTSHSGLGLRASVSSAVLPSVGVAAERASVSSLGLPGVGKASDALAMNSAMSGGDIKSLDLSSRSRLGYKSFASASNTSHWVAPANMTLANEIFGTLGSNASVQVHGLGMSGMTTPSTSVTGAARKDTLEGFVGDLVLEGSSSEGLGVGAPLMAAATEAAVPTVSAPLRVVQTGLFGLHSLLGGPWWFTIVSGTLLLRSSLVPVSIWQMRTTRRMLGGAVAGHMQHLGKLYTKELQDPTANRVKLTQLYLKGVRSIFRKFKVNPLAIVAVPITQLAVLLTFVWATRNLVIHGALDLSEQGALWFMDLGAKDTTMILPLVAVSLSYSTLERSFGRTEQVPGQPLSITAGDVVREILQSMLVFGFPFIAQLPSGIFMYWIPSSLFGYAQSSIMRLPSVRAALGVGPGPQLNARPIVQRIPESPVLLNQRPPHSSKAASGSKSSSVNSPSSSHASATPSSSSSPLSPPNSSSSSTSSKPSTK